MVTKPKALKSDFDSFSNFSYSINASSSLSDLVGDGSGSGGYSPFSLAQLRLLKEVAQPSYNPNDYDPDLTGRVVSKMFAIQSGRAVSDAIQRSELQQTYRAALRGIKTVQERFRYSVQHTGRSVAVSRRNLGRKLVELNVDFNLRQGVDPQIRFGDHIRLRYDWVNNRSMLEYGVEF